MDKQARLVSFAYRCAPGAGRKPSLTLQWVSWISSCWNMYAVTKQNNSDISGKPTVARHSRRNDSARYTELLLLPTLFSSILAAPLSILAFVREADGGHGGSKSGSRSDGGAARTHAAPRAAGSLDGPRRRSAYHGIPPATERRSRISNNVTPLSHPLGPGGGGGGP